MEAFPGMGRMRLSRTGRGAGPARGHEQRVDRERRAGDGVIGGGGPVAGSCAARHDGQVELPVLGPLEVEHAGGAVPRGSRKRRAVLAILLLRANEVVPADTLVDELWGERPPPSAWHTLQAYVSRLRQAFRAAGLDDGVLQTQPPGYGAARRLRGA